MDDLRNHPEMREFLTSDLKLLAEARSLHNRAATRIWLFTATMTLTVFSAKVSADNTVQMIGFHMDSSMLYPVLATLLVLSNIVYISSHIQAYKTVELFHSYLVEIDADNINFAGRYTLADAAHALYSPNINRIFPLTNQLPQPIRPLAFLIFKWTFDVILATLPACGLLYALYHTDHQAYYFPALVIFSAVSTTATAILLFTTLGYTFGRFKKSRF